MTRTVCIKDINYDISDLISTSTLTYNELEVDFCPYGDFQPIVQILKQILDTRELHGPAIQCTGSV